MSNLTNESWIENRIEEASEFYFSNAPKPVTEKDFEAWFGRNFKDCITPTDYSEKLDEIKRSHEVAIENIREHGHGE